MTSDMRNRIIRKISWRKSEPPRDKYWITADTGYMLESALDSSSGIASDDHNATSGNSESSPTFSTFKDVVKPTSSHNSKHRTAKPVKPPVAPKNFQGRRTNQMTTFQNGSIDSQSDCSDPPPPARLPIAYQETDLDDLTSDQRYVINQRLFGDSSLDTPTSIPVIQHSRYYNSDYSSESAEYVYSDAVKKPKGVSYFEVLPDHVISKIFSNLSSDQLCRCARVCRRWYNLTWDPMLWTTIRINNSVLNVDKALKALTRRLSYDTPTVCVMVERINLSGCEHLTDRGLMIVAKRCPELRMIELQGCPNITNIAMFELVSRCVNLEHINVAACPCITCISLTPEATLQAQTYGKQIYVRYLDMTDCYQLEDTGLQIIASYCSQLQYLYLRRCANVSDIGVQYVANYCSLMKELSISDCKNVGDFGMKEIARLGTSLRYLSVAKCDRISDVGVRHVARYCYKLRYLNLRGCEGVSDDSAEMIATYCTRLKSLDIGKCDITDDGLDMLGQSLGHLRKLSLKGCEAISDKGVGALAYHCPQLHQLNVQECHLTVEGYRTVKKYCKRCIIEHTNPGFY